MTTKSKVENLARRLNVSMDHDDSAGYYDTTFYCDDGYIFEASGASCLVVSWFKSSSKPEYWKEVFTELSEGVAKQ